MKNWMVEGPLSPRRGWRGCRPLSDGRTVREMVGWEVQVTEKELAKGMALMQRTASIKTSVLHRSCLALCSFC
jgi:hypothetical protein